MGRGWWHLVFTAVAFSVAFAVRYALALLSVCLVIGIPMLVLLALLALVL